MAIRSKDIYQGNKKTHKVAKTIVIAAVCLIVLVVGAFFWLRQYCVYDAEGNATLISPFSSSQKADNPE